MEPFHFFPYFSYSKWPPFLLCSIPLMHCPLAVTAAFPFLGNNPSPLFSFFLFPSLARPLPCLVLSQAMHARSALQYLGDMAEELGDGDGCCYAWLDVAHVKVNDERAGHCNLYHKGPCKTVTCRSACGCRFELLMV